MLWGKKKKLICCISISRSGRDRGGGPREREGSRSGTGPSGPPGGGMDSDDSRRSRYPDSHQVFVGNLPHNTTEIDLKSFFSRKLHE